MKILITGGTGYIGSRLTRRALLNKHDVILASHRAVENNLPWVKFDLGDKPSIQLSEPVDVIFHLAANTSSTHIDEQGEISSAKELIGVAQKYDARFVFVSSQAASHNAPTSYGRVKWHIEQEVLQAKGIVARLGQVYGGPEAALFGTLADFVRKMPVLPAFIPSPLIQPIHVDDSVSGLLKLVEITGVQSDVYCLASPVPVTFTSFLRTIARYRVRKPRFYVPVPTALVKFLSILSRPKLSARSGLNRLNSLFELPAMNTATDIESIGLELRSLKSGMHRSGNDQRRKLIQEAKTLLAYIMKTKPSSNTVRRYVRMIELLHDGNPVSFPTLMNKWPVFVSLIDYQTLTDSPQQQIFNWRIDAATVIAEASIEGANRFLGNQQPVWRIKAYICMLLAVICDLMWRLLRLIVPSSLIRIS